MFDPNLKIRALYKKKRSIIRTKSTMHTHTSNIHIYICVVNSCVHISHIHFNRLTFIYNYNLTLDNITFYL